MPIEQSKVCLPPYRIEPPDILFIDAIKVVPKAPYRISPQDTLQIRAAGTLADQPINGYFVVEPGGAVELGPAYGKVNVAGLSLDEATESVENQLRRLLKQPQVSLTLAQSAGQQQIAGEHLVGPDGRINLGIYGSVYVSGMTVNEARHAIQTHLTRFLDDPRVAVDVGAFNSKVYYVITEGAGFGDSVSRFSVTGNETVLDAMAQINGLSRLASKSHIWIARPGPQGSKCDQILPINWDKITQDGETATNYQVLPGDRIFIAADKFYAFDTALGNVIAPIQRVMGVATLGVQTVFGIQHPGSLGRQRKYWRQPLLVVVKVRNPWFETCKSDAGYLRCSCCRWPQGRRSQPDGVIGGMVGPNCPRCNASGSGPCPANVKYFGYYPTRWRHWPGTEPAPTPAVQAPTIPVEVPPPDQESSGKPGGTTGDMGTANPPAGATTDSNGPSTPASPNATPSWWRADAQRTPGAQCARCFRMVRQCQMCPFPMAFRSPKADRSPIVCRRPTSPIRRPRVRNFSRRRKLLWRCRCAPGPSEPVQLNQA